ncbi:uncharacterized protein KY384_001930 [Bacidia gigantensis]|uniref:uncharacterized protein n=1 Tax=Bacidia gigantensis TaxID=2732470 RepID=UPI001D04FA6E|nr:uncharacterized protein KY384_001930 [Bacidia gigantensis]KAG8533147.1 hypothetical protein KY384_001930 [Bacidia gigantensis]
MSQKKQANSMVADIATSQSVSAESDVDTEFEDASDFDDYQGRRSEESFGNTTISTFDELRTPASNDFKGFNFCLPTDSLESGASKTIQGPVGPHLFRHSQESTPAEEIYLEWSPIVKSPTDNGHISTPNRVSFDSCPPAELPLEQWTTHHVAAWMRNAGFEEHIIEKFRMNDISGGLLKHLEFGDLKELGITSFGQRHLLWDEIRNLRGGVSVPPTPADECLSPSPPIEEGARHVNRDNECAFPTAPEESKAREPKLHRRRARRALRPDDIISPAESASIVAIEQLLPEPHKCSKGDDCAKYRRYKRKMERIAKEFPMELEQIEEANASPSEITVQLPSEADPSVVGSSDVLGGRRPALRLDPDLLRTVQNRDPQENVRQFLTFQHMAGSPPEPSTPPYEMFPPLSPPENTQAPHTNLRSLPKLQIPDQASPSTAQDPDRTIIQQHRSPITAIEHNGQDIYRFASPASAMDVPLTAIPLGPIERDFSNSVPPDMRYGSQSISRSHSRAGYRAQPFEPIDRSQSAAPLERSASSTQRRMHPGFGLPVVQESHHLSPIIDAGDKTPTLADVQHAGWMKKRKTKMLRHEWHDNHFRLKGTTLAMHSDNKTLDALEYIDVDEYAVACSSIASNKVNTAFRALKLGASSTKKKGPGPDGSAFTFQLVPSSEKKGILGAATGKTHHFAVKNRDDRIDWMRELMLAKALKEKGAGCEVTVA